MSARTRPWRIDLLAPRHDRAGFSCGEPALDAYIHHLASQDARRRIAQVFVAIGEAPSLVMGYYSLSVASFAREELPAEKAKQLPRYPVPAAIIGRLAVALDRQGRGLGSLLLADALRRVLHASSTMAVHAVLVEAKNERAKAFYERFGFKAFPNTPRRLFLPLATIARANA